MGCQFLLQGVFLIQGSNPLLLLGKRILYHWAAWEASSFFFSSFRGGDSIQLFQEDQKLSDTQPSSPPPSFYFALLHWSMTGY